MDITKETIKINKIICEKKEQIVVQGDMIVPDSKPDILNTINTDGNICIYKKEVFEGKLRLEGNIVSYDYRDVGYKVKSILFIPKEYVIYINVDLFQNEMNMLVKCYQTARQMYHTIQVYNQLQSKELSESTTTVNQWRYCYIERKNSKPSGITPVQADMMAFSIVMMKKYHYINIEFKENDYFGWESLLKDMKSRYL